MKLIRTSSGEHHLFDLCRDPVETSDLALDRPELVATLAAKLDAFPRGPDVGLPLWRIVLDPDEFGGEERGPPMTARTPSAASPGIPPFLLVPGAIAVLFLAWLLRRGRAVRS